MFENFLILAFSLFIAFVSASNEANSTSSTGENIGDFKLIVPKKKGMYKVGTTLKIQWEVQPKGLSPPSNVTVDYRVGQWDKPDVPWTVLATDIPNEGYYNWDIPENQFISNKYVIRISTKQREPSWIRDKTSELFAIYAGTPVIDGNILFTDDAQKSDFSIGVLVLVCLLQIIIN